MRLQFFFILLSSFIIGLSSCEDSPSFKGPKRLGQIVTGKVGQILVICDDPIWDSEVKAYLDTNLTQFIMPYFPDVPTFLLIHKTEAHFNQGVKRYRNTLFLKIDPKHKGDKAEIHIRKDVWAIDQLVVDIVAKDYNQLLAACKSGLKSVHSEFDKMEWKRILNQYEESDNSNISGALETNFGIHIDLPEGARLVNKKPNFVRIDFPIANRPIEFANAGTQESGTIFSGVLVYQYDYLDSTQFYLEQLLEARDTMLKYNAPYEIEGMYMGTQYTPLVYPEGNEMISDIGKVKGYEIRGMYVYVGKPIHAPGGAFWAFHFKHPKRNKLVCISGFLDAPSTTTWTHQLREIQAVLKSVEFTD